MVNLYRIYLRQMQQITNNNNRQQQFDNFTSLLSKRINNNKQINTVTLWKPDALMFVKKKCDTNNNKKGRVFQLTKKNRIFI